MDHHHQDLLDRRAYPTSGRERAVKDPGGKGGGAGGGGCVEEEEKRWGRGNHHMQGSRPRAGLGCHDF